MADRQRSVEDQIEILRRELGDLGRRVEKLENLLVEGGTFEAGDTKDRPDKGGGGEASEKVLSWVGAASLLPRLATVCFLMVVALVLRTVTDNEILARETGSLVGMAYAFALIAWGWLGYRRGSSLAPVFTVSGAFLIFSVVVETHEHFESLSTVPAYLIIFATGSTLAAISHMHRVALPVFVGTLGMCFAGVALDFPRPVFPYLFVLLLSANILGAFATRLQRCSWLRWMLFAITVFMMLIWVFRLGIYLTQIAPQDLPFAIRGYFPAAAILSSAYMITALLGILGRITARISKFDYALPALNGLWAFATARYVVNAGLGSETMLGLWGLVAGGVHFGLAVWLGKRNVEGARGTNSFTLAGSLLLAMALPMVVGSRPPALAALSLLGLAVALGSRKWRSGGMRVTSYGIQAYACLALAGSLWSAEGTSPSLVGAAASGALAVIAFWHYLWSRNNPPPAESYFFERFDRRDRLVVLLLLAALVGGYFTLRTGIYQAIGMLGDGTVDGDVFSAAQTALINAGATVLMCFALARRNKELRNVAILVTVVGGIKVFLVDLFGLEGVPIVLSVLSFGVAASLESFALSRWQRIDQLRISRWPREAQKAGKEDERGAVRGK